MTKYIPKLDVTESPQYKPDFNQCGFYNDDLEPIRRTVKICDIAYHHGFITDDSKIKKVQIADDFFRDISPMAGIAYLTRSLAALANKVGDIAAINLQQALLGTGGSTALGPGTKHPAVVLNELIQVFDAVKGATEIGDDTSEDKEQKIRAFRYEAFGSPNLGPKDMAELSHSLGIVRANLKSRLRKLQSEQQQTSL